MAVTPALEQRVGALPAGGQVQVGEQHLPLAHPVVLLLDRLLDLEDQVAGLPHVVGGRQDPRARGDEVGVGDGRAGPRVLLQEDLVPVPDQLVHAGRRDRHAVLVILDFLGNADLHDRGSSLVTGGYPAPLPSDSPSAHTPRWLQGLRSARRAQGGIPVPPGGIRGQDTHPGHPVVHVTCEKARARPPPAAPRRRSGRPPRPRARSAARRPAPRSARGPGRCAAARC